MHYPLQVEEELKQEANMSPERQEALAAFREFPGNRPSNSFLVDRVTPFTLGAMVAVYEHKTFVQVGCQTRKLGTQDWGSYLTSD